MIARMQLNQGLRTPSFCCNAYGDDFAFAGRSEDDPKMERVILFVAG
jgi:hypothetical protein